MFGFNSNAFAMPAASAPAGMLAEGSMFGELNPNLKTQLAQIEYVFLCGWHAWLCSC